MSVDELQLVNQREEVLDEVEKYLIEHQGQSLYPDDIVKAFRPGGISESVILSAIWRLIDEHRIDLDKRLSIVTAI